MEQPTHALFIVDNWDGEGDRYWIFGYQRDGVWHSHESEQVVLQHQGDEILKTVLLK